MNHNYSGNINPSMIPSQSTYPPYTDFPGYGSSTSVSVNGTSSNIPMTPPTSQPDPQYAESVFSKNHGKKVTVYLSYPDSVEWRDRAFTGTILADGRDYLLLKDVDGKTIILWLVYINYAIFDADVNVNY